MSDDAFDDVVRRLWAERYAPVPKIDPKVAARARALGPTEQWRLALIHQEQQLVDLKQWRARRRHQADERRRAAR